MAKSKLEDKVTLAVEPEPEPLTLELLSNRMDKMVNVMNNVIAYCNTIEKWRTMAFRNEEPAKKNLSTEAEKTEKS